MGKARLAEMTDAEIYLAAAEWLDKQPAGHRNGMCKALGKFTHSDAEYSRVYSPLHAYLFPSKPYFHGFWGVDFASPHNLGLRRDIMSRTIDYEYVKQCRVFALCFMAALAESGDLNDVRKKK